MKDKGERRLNEEPGDYSFTSGTLKCPLCKSLKTSIVTDANKRYLYCKECGYSCCYPECTKR